MTVFNRVVAAVIALIATRGNVASWWIVLASPIVLCLTIAAIFIENFFFGWNWRWRSAWGVEASEPNGYQINLWLRPKNRALEHPVPDVECRVYTSGGSSHTARGQFVQGDHWAYYPLFFDGATPLAAGEYRVEWRREPYPGPGVWREVLTHRAKVSSGVLNL